jgi:hypothetical protein
MEESLSAYDTPEATKDGDDGGEPKFKKEKKEKEKEKKKDNKDKKKDKKSESPKKSVSSSPKKKTKKSSKTVVGDADPQDSQRINSADLGGASVDDNANANADDSSPKVAAASDLADATTKSSKSKDGDKKKEKKEKKESKKEKDVSTQKNGSIDSDDGKRKDRSIDAEGSKRKNRTLDADDGRSKRKGRSVDDERKGESSKRGSRSTDKESPQRKNRSVDEFVPDIQKKDDLEPFSSAWNDFHAVSKEEKESTDSLKAENEALAREAAVLRTQLSETETLVNYSESLRKQLADALESLEKNEEMQRQDRAQLSKVTAELTQVKMDFNRIPNEAVDLNAHIEECEKAIAEKDGLIKKLTEAVDCQFAKNDFLELKLQRAEEEFCKMEDEMEELEEEIVSLKEESGSAASLSRGSSHSIRRESGHSIGEASGHSTARSDSSLKGVAIDMQRRLDEDRLNRLEDREQNLQEREAEMEDREGRMDIKVQELIGKEKELLEQEQKIGNLDELDGLRQQRLEEWEKELFEMESRLTAEQEKQREKRHDEEYERLEKARVGAQVEVDQKFVADDLNHELKAMTNELDRFKGDIRKLSEEKEALEEKLLTKDAESGDFTNILQEKEDTITELNEKVAEFERVNKLLMEKEEERDREDADREKNGAKMQERRDEELEMIQVSINKQLQELDSENLQLQQEAERLKEEKLLLNAQNNNGTKRERHIVSVEADSGETDGNSAELQKEIAELREQIVKKAQEMTRQRVETDRRLGEKEELKQELLELERDFKDLQGKIEAEKLNSKKKLAKKEETVVFMQNEIVRMMKQKQEADAKERQRQFDEAEQSVTKMQVGDDEAEMIRIQGINLQLRQLDDENQRLQTEFNDWQTKSTNKLKDRDANLLKLNEELDDLKDEIGARKEADYVTLLKDRKERKQKLNKAKKDLKLFEDRAALLEQEVGDLRVYKLDAEADIEELKKSIVARDSEDYVSSLARQIKSLKEHNKVLERELETEGEEYSEYVKQSEENIAQLEKDLAEFKQRLIRQRVKGIPAAISSDDVPASKLDVSIVSSFDSFKAADPEATPRRSMGMKSLWSKISTPLSASKPLLSFGFNAKVAVDKPPSEEDNDDKKRKESAEKEVEERIADNEDMEVPLDKVSEEKACAKDEDDNGDPAAVGPLEEDNEDKEPKESAEKEAKEPIADNEDVQAPLGEVSEAKADEKEEEGDAATEENPEEDTENDDQEHHQDNTPSADTHEEASELDSEQIAEAGGETAEENHDAVDASDNTEDDNLEVEEQTESEDAENDEENDGEEAPHEAQEEEESEEEEPETGWASVRDESSDEANESEESGDEMSPATCVDVERRIKVNMENGLS